MRRAVVKLIVIGSLIFGFSICREEKKDVEKRDTIERAGDEAEDGVERAAEEVKGAYKDVKEEVDGQTDDN
ncbi:hypothetical protein OO010_07000 [Flavobacteriaceae bacterium KMM 6898]|nr:hypothetical protein [Flavobacteriaceae bacterium KMM 6898]